VFSALVFGLGLSAAQLPVVTATATAATKADPLAGLDSDGDGTRDMPDSATAAQAARKVGKRVEDLSQRTPTTQVFANADGTWTTEASAGPVRAQDPETGKWSPIDTTVKKNGSRWQPASALGDVSFSGGGDGPLALMRDVDGKELSWSWPDPLPAPEVKGSTLTYPDVVPHGDLVVEARPGGFSHSVVLRQAPTGPLSLPVLVDTDGASLSEMKDGSLSITTRREELVSAPQPMMWDASGDPTDRATAAEAKPVPVDVDVGAAGGGRSRVELSPDPEFLSDPGTTYPVTIDPTYTVSASASIVINSPSTPYLMVGGGSATTNAYRSLVGFDASTVFSGGEHIESAQFSLYNNGWSGCAPQALKVQRATSIWGSGTTWATQPSVTTAGESVATQDAHCSAAGWESWDITGIAQAWADGAPAYGVRVTAADETQGALRYYEGVAAPTGDPSLTPKLTLTGSAPALAGAAPVPSDSRQWLGDVFVRTQTPAWTTAAIDPDGGLVRYKIEVHDGTGAGSNVVASCTTGFVGSGTESSCTPTTPLSNGTYYARSAADDGTALGAWSPWRKVTVNYDQPEPATVSCPSFADAHWYATRPASTMTCTFSSPGAVQLEWSLNGVVQMPRSANGSGAATTLPITIPASGWTSLKVRGTSNSGLASGWTDFSFGTGTGQLISPISGATAATTISLQAAAAAGMDSATFQWRPSSSSTWTNATQVFTGSGGAWAGTVDDTGFLSSTSELTWRPAAEAGMTIPSVVYVRAQFVDGSTTYTTAARSVTVAAHAAGNAAPSASVGPGTIQLGTGEFESSATDVSVGSMGVSRTHLSNAAPGAGAGASSVFGPGWSASLGSGGPASSMVTDQRAETGSLLFTTPDGTVYTFRSASPAASNLTGAFAAIGDAKALDATVSIDGSTEILSYADAGGTVTTFKLTAGRWTPTSTIGTGTESTTNYFYDASGLPTWIIAPAPAGITCTQTDLNPGCQALEVTYTTVASAQRVASIDYHAWDPKLNDTDGDHDNDGAPDAEAAMSSTTIAKYDYNTDGTLQAVWDPRVADGSSALKTTYTYTSAGTGAATRTRLSSITPPGLKTWQINYDSDGAVSTITREQDAAVGTGNATWTVKYGLKLNAEGDGLPNLSAAKTAAWGQPATDAPDTGAAVFGPSKVPASTPTATDWTYATLYYWNAAGRLTNTASNGTGSWQINTARYDESGNAVWTLTPAAKARAISDGAGNDANAAVAADRYATWTLYNAEGSRAEVVYGPMLTAVTEDGTSRQARSLTQYVYDDEADASLVPARPTTNVPDGGFGLVAEVRESATDETAPGTWAIAQNTPPSSAVHLYDTTKTRYRYDAAVTGDPSGWTLRQPTAILAQNGSDWDKTVYRYDTAGRLTQERSPQGVASNDPVRWHDTVYYTADESATRSYCRSKPRWAGLICWEGPAAQPSTGQQIPSTSYEGYSLGLSTTRAVATSGSATKTGISGFDAAGRQVRAATTTSGTGDQSVAATSMTYSATTGLTATMSDGTMTMTTGFDTWGRVTSQSDGGGNTATTSYDAAGQIATVNDGKGTYSYAYNDRRGLATSVNPGVSGVSLSGTYDADGRLTTKRTLSSTGEVDEYSTFDLAGHLTSSTHLGVVSSTYVSWTDNNKVDVSGRVRIGTETGRQQTYDYDDRGRLVQVTDQKTTSGATDCYIRRYTLTADSNRTSLATYNPTTAGACQTTTGSATTSTYDGADRITNTGYAYDDLGRTTTVAAADTPNSVAGNVSATYFADDMVASLTQGNASQTFTLDPLGRVSTTKNLTNGISLVETTDHYADTSDSPAWTETKTRPNASTAWTTTWTRYVRGLDGKLTVIQGSSGNSQAPMYNTHGDLTRTIDLTSGVLSTYTYYNEFGTIRLGAVSSGRYGWLGQSQRDSQGVGGLILMGVRRYNPATGRFLSPDSVRGGNDNSYTYPLDPCNHSDLTGLACDSRFRDWYSISWTDIKWMKWQKTSDLSGPTGYIRDQLEEIYGLAPFRFKIVDKNIHGGYRYVTQRRCANGKWQYRDGTIYLAQYRWKVTVVIVWVQVPGGVWIDGAATVTKSVYFNPRSYK